MMNEDLPALYIAADKASGSAQRKYFCVLRAQLAAFIIVSALATLGAFCHTYRQDLYMAAVVILAIGLIITFIARERKYDRIWFDCRAIAESLKTATWRYMMRIFDGAYNDEARVRFVGELNEIRTSRVQVAQNLTGRTASTAVITAQMDKVRSSEFLARRQFYRTERLDDQQQWYSNKVVTNRRTGAIWYWTTILFQVAALVVAAVIARLGSPFGPVSLLMTLAASATAWTQARRHDELTNSYALAADELTRLQALAERITDEREFAKLVEDVEEACSREHTMWCARRSLIVKMPGAGS